MPADPISSDDLKVTARRSSVAVEPKGWRKLIPFSVRRHSQGWRVQISWKPFVLFLLSSILLGWLSLASSAYFFVKYNRGFTDVSFTDMLFLRWHDYEVSRGNFLISRAQEELKQQKFREAFGDLRLGLIKSPANKEGRLLLAEFYNLWKRPDLCRSTLLDGFSYLKTDVDYLKSLLTFLIKIQDDKQVLKLYHELLDQDSAINPRNQIVALAAASSCYFRGNYDTSDSILRAYQLDSSRDGRLLIARINWERGTKELALDQVRQLGTELPNDEEAYSLTTHFLRELGRDAEARRESFIQTLANPRNARAHIDLLYALQSAGDLATLHTQIEEFYTDFSKDSNALVALADFAANSGDIPLAQRVYAYTKAKNMNWEGPALMTVESCIVAQKYQTALELVRQLLKENPEWAKRFYAAFNGLQAIANYGLGDPDAAQLFLNNFLKQDDVRSDNLIAVSKRLLTVGAKTQARQVLEQAVQTDALNQAALTSLVQLDLELNNPQALTDNVRKLLTMRKPSQTVLQAAYAKLSSDLFLFSPDRSELLGAITSSLTPTAATP
jgi:Flp pilus assembly protein TadD